MSKSFPLNSLLFVLLSGPLAAEPIERPKAGATVTEKVEFYVGRLGDATYGEKLKPSDGHASFWHTAPEELGQIGSPAIEPLIKRVEISRDATELTWAFYALMLASQSQDIKAEIGPIRPDNCDGYIYEKNHARLKNLWLDWWKKYGSAIQGLAAKQIQKPQAEQGVAPNRSSPPSQNATSPVRGSED